MKYKLGIIGFGGMARWHNELLAETDNIIVAGIYDIKKEPIEYAKSIGLFTYESEDALLLDPEIDLILIATPNDVHKSIALKAMMAHKNVICEKPITLSSNDLEEMITVSKKTGMFLTVHQNRRWDEDFLTIKKIISDHTLGDIFRIESRVHGSRGIPGDWRQEKEHGGGMVYDWGVHLLDQILLLFPEQKLTKVYAILHHVTNQLVDDGFMAELTFESGITVMVEVGTSNFISLPRWYVLGENGTALIEDWDLNGRIICANGINELDVVPIKTAAGLTKTMAPRRDDSIFTKKLPKVHGNIKEFYQNVTSVLDGAEKSCINLNEVGRVMKLMECIFESARLQKVMDFE